MNRFGEYGNDAPAHFLMFLLLSEIIKNFNNIKIKDISNYFLLSIFIIMNKVILITSILFPLVFFIKNKMTLKLIDKKFFFIITFLILWCLKNILVSGCLLYPLKISCFTNLNWTDMEKTTYVSKENEAWAKGWPDYRKLNVKNISQSEYSKDFFWLKTWINNHFLIILKTLIPYLALLAFLLLILKNKKSKKLNSEKFINILAIISLTGMLIWFYKVPVFRYGYSYIIISISLLFAIIANSYKLKKKSFVISKYLILILLIFFTIKNLNRIVFENKNYFNYPWPKFYSYNKDNKILKHQYRIINNKKIYMPIDEYCMYSQAPCGYINKNLKVKILNNYLFMIIDS